MAPDLLRRHEDILRHVLVLKVLIVVLAMAGIVVGACAHMWWLLGLAWVCLMVNILTEPGWLTKRDHRG